MQEGAQEPPGPPQMPPFCLTGHARAAQGPPPCAECSSLCRAQRAYLALPSKDPGLRCPSEEMGGQGGVAGAVPFHGAFRPWWSAPRWSPCSDA